MNVVKFLLGVLSALWMVWTTLFLSFHCLLEGTIELKAKPLWVVGIFILVGSTCTTYCMFKAFGEPTENPKCRARKKK